MTEKERKKRSKQINIGGEKYKSFCILCFFMGIDDLVSWVV